MSDELRVTVVATGIGKDCRPDVTLTSGTSSTERVTEVPKASSLPQSAATESAVSVPVAAKSKPQTEHDYLDIPAFLRKQAD
jgi:cell division protein FtsZ